jgi:hypothetical protein
MDPITWETPPHIDNFVRFKLDGLVMESDDWLLGPSTYVIQRYDEHSIYAPMDHKDTAQGTFSLLLPSFEPGTYFVSDSLTSSTGIATYFTGDSKHSRYYTTSMNATGSVIITQFDTVAKLLKGTFSLELEMIGPKPEGVWLERIRLTEGVFDFDEEKLSIR